MGNPSLERVFLRIKLCLTPVRMDEDGVLEVAYRLAN
jgi:hypothetical protein